MVCIFIDRYKDLRGRDVNCWQNNGKFILPLLSLVAFDSEKIKPYFNKKSRKSRGGYRKLLRYVLMILTSEIKTILPCVNFWLIVFENKVRSFVDKVSRLMILMNPCILQKVPFGILKKIISADNIIFKQIGYIVASKY